MPVTGIPCRPDPSVVRYSESMHPMRLSKNALILNQRVLAPPRQPQHKQCLPGANKGMTFRIQRRGQAPQQRKVTSPHLFPASYNPTKVISYLKRGESSCATAFHGRVATSHIHAVLHLVDRRPGDTVTPNESPNGSDELAARQSQLRKSSVGHGCSSVFQWDSRKLSGRESSIR